IDEGLGAYVAGFAPVKARVGHENPNAADEEPKHAQHHDPVGNADEEETPWRLADTIDVRPCRCRRDEVQTGHKSAPVRFGVHGRIFALRSAPIGDIANPLPVGDGRSRPLHVRRWLVTIGSGVVRQQSTLLSRTPLESAGSAARSIRSAGETKSPLLMTI